MYGFGKIETPQSLERITFLGLAVLIKSFNKFSFVPCILCFSPSTCVNGTFVAFDIKKYENSNLTLYFFNSDIVFKLKVFDGTKIFFTPIFFAYFTQINSFFC